MLHEQELITHREATRPRTHRRPDEHVATGPRQVWSRDITYLRSATRGAFYYLYLVLDISSRKIAAAEVHERESSEIASSLVEWACERESVARDALVLHADNGGPMKGATMLAPLQRLGVIPSFSRPSVSDDNAFAEALFRTLKYRPGYTKAPFASLDEARVGRRLRPLVQPRAPAQRHPRRDAGRPKSWRGLFVREAHGGAC